MALSTNNKQVILAAVTFVVLVLACQSSSGALLDVDPLVDTGVSKLSPEGRHVAVHVPAFFNMQLDTRGRGKGYRLDTSVMGSLVKLHLNRVRASNGSLTGPIQVDVGGMTMYHNDEPEPTN